MPRFRRLPVAALLAGGLVVYASLAVSSMRTTSAAYDETAHLPAGYTYLTLRDFRMNPEHPPLAKELAALPLLLLDVRSRTGLPAWQLGQEWEFGHRFLYQWNNADRLLFWGRLPVVALGRKRLASPTEGSTREACAPFSELHGCNSPRRSARSGLWMRQGPT